LLAWSCFHYSCVYYFCTIFVIHQKKLAAVSPFSVISEILLVLVILLCGEKSNFKNSYLLVSIEFNELRETTVEIGIGMGGQDHVLGLEHHNSLLDK
jgi:hypothetical protein